MPNEIVQFSFEGAGVRVVDINGKVEFIAKDVAGLLGYSNLRAAVAQHCKAARADGVVIRDAIGRSQSMTTIPERDVYRLIMRSKLPAAERFEEWVVGEVLPSIRKNGGYVAGQETLSPEEILAKAILVANKVIAEKQARIEALEPVAAVAGEAPQSALG